MSKVLAIIANPKREEQAYSLKVANYFLDEYKKKNPEDEIIKVDVYEEDLPFIDGDVFEAWGKLSTGVEFSSLSADEQAKVGNLNRLLEQHIEADKYVFVSPLWNFSIPPKLKAYIDAITIAGKTFAYTEAGPVGLLKDKKAVHIQASGGVFSEGPASAMDFGHRYVKALNAFLGVEDMEALLIEGTAIPDKTEDDRLKEAYEKANTLALAF